MLGGMILLFTSDTCSIPGKLAKSDPIFFSPHLLDPLFWGSGRRGCQELAGRARGGSKYVGCCRIKEPQQNHDVVTSRKINLRHLSKPPVFLCSGLALMFMIYDVYFCTLLNLSLKEPCSDGDSEGWMLRKQISGFGELEKQSLLEAQSLGRFPAPRTQI